jgi:hypothetical protein
MSEERPSKRQKQCSSDEQILEGLEVLLDWLEQFPSASTCNIILVSPKLRLTSRLYRLPTLRVPRLNARDVSLTNMKWFSSFPGKCPHSFGKVAARNGDILLLKTLFVYSNITREFYNFVAENAIKQDNLLLLSWARGFDVKERAGMKSVRFRELKLAIQFGAIAILRFLETPKTIQSAFSNVTQVHRLSWEWLKVHYPKIWNVQQLRVEYGASAAYKGDLELLKFLRDCDFRVSYTSLYAAACSRGHLHIMQWAHETLFVEGESSVPTFINGTAESLELYLRHYPDADKINSFFSTSLDVHRVILEKTGKLPTALCCKFIIAGRSKEISSLEFKITVEDLANLELHALTPEQMKLLLNAGLTPNQTLFDIALQRMSVDICKLLYTSYEGLTVHWPKVSALQTREKWIWIDSIVLFDTAHAFNFAKRCFVKQNIDSFRWVAEKLQGSDLLHIRDWVKWNPQYAIALCAKHPDLSLPEECFDAENDWGRDEIEFLVEYRHIIYIPDGFCPNFPDDFEFYQATGRKIDWTCTKKKLLKRISTTWSEVNFQHFLESQ